MNNINNILIIDSEVENLHHLSRKICNESWNFEISRNTDLLTRPNVNNLDHIYHIKQYDLVILGIMLDSVNGFDLVKSLREYSDIPLLILSKLGDDIDRIIGLELGADDYLHTSIHPREISARIRRLLKRHNNSSSCPTPPRFINVDHTTLDTVNGTANHHGQNIDLTVTEHRILRQLMTRAGKVVSREDLSIYSLGRKLSSYDRCVDILVCKLRSKLVTPIFKTSPIVTIRGVGYQFICHHPSVISGHLMDTVSAA